MEKRTKHQHLKEAISGPYQKIQRFGGRGGCDRRRDDPDVTDRSGSGGDLQQ
jgi:hypothetical protein